jgi:hypothetical protein
MTSDLLSYISFLLLFSANSQFFSPPLQNYKRDGNAADQTSEPNLKEGIFILWFNMHLVVDFSKKKVDVTSV